MKYDICKVDIDRPDVCKRVVELAREYTCMRWCDDEAHENDYFIYSNVPVSAGLASDLVFANCYVEGGVNDVDVVVCDSGKEARSLVIECARRFDFDSEVILPGSGTPVIVFSSYELSTSRRDALVTEVMRTRFLP